MTTLISVFLKIAPCQDVDAEGATSCITEQSFLFRNEWCIDFHTESNFCFRKKGVAFLAIVYCIQYLGALSAYGSFQYNQIERGPIQQDLSPMNGMILKWQEYNGDLGLNVDTQS